MSLRGARRRNPHLQPAPSPRNCMLGQLHVQTWRSPAWPLRACLRRTPTAWKSSSARSFPSKWCVWACVGTRAATTCRRAWRRWGVPPPARLPAHARTCMFKVGAWSPPLGPPRPHGPPRAPPWAQAVRYVRWTKGRCAVHRRPILAARIQPLLLRGCCAAGCIPGEEGPGGCGHATALAHLPRGPDAPLVLLDHLDAAASWRSPTSPPLHAHAAGQRQQGA